jgi:hypothetical protein
MLKQSQSRREMSPRERVFMALVFFIFSGFQFALAIDWIHPTDKHGTVLVQHGTNWMLVASAALFAFGGLMILLIETRYAKLRNLVMWLFVVSLAVLFNWVAFGSGERHFGSSSSLGSVSSFGKFFEIEGRVIFGAFAVLLDILVLLFPYRLYKQARNK